MITLSLLECLLLSKTPKYYSYKHLRPSKYTHLEHSDFCTIFGQDDDFSPFCDFKISQVLKIQTDVSNSSYKIALL